MSPLKKILIVEDDEKLLGVLVAKFSKEGFLVLKANNGEEGLSVALKEHPDLIMLDNLMPKMDGMTVMRNLREDSWGKNVPIFILTAYDINDETIKDVEEGHPTYYLVKKMIDLDDVLKKVKDTLEKVEKHPNEDIEKLK